ncbi:MAG TPA: ferritin-like domain-containing protein [Gemmatimonadales bacterium]|jgi:ferritin-like metal-binding protein YciE|nr:ferritin-like domain-containing protein [Gemmatimonadales bacterium]
MTMDTLRALLAHELQDLYSAEQQLVEALPKMEEGATDPDLKQAIRDHLKQTRAHVDRLDNAFGALGVSASGEMCRGMQGLIEEGAKMLKEKGDAAVRDAGIISAAQRIEHYEIAGYGSARTFAQKLGENGVAELLQKTLDEEGETDERLTHLAKSKINAEAMAG